MVTPMATGTLARQYQISEDGHPMFVPANPTAERLVGQAANVFHADGWEAADGEELSVLVLRDHSGIMVGAVPAPADDEPWLTAFERSPVLVTKNARGQTKQLTIVPG